MGFGAALIQRREVDSGHFQHHIFRQCGGRNITYADRNRPVMGVRFVFQYSGRAADYGGLILRFHHKFVFPDPAGDCPERFTVSRFGDKGYLRIALRRKRGIILAWFDFGVWSLVAQSLITSAMGAVLLWYMSAWRPRAEEFSFQCVKELWPYSSKMFAFAVLKYFTMNTDKLVIGYFLGPVALDCTPLPIES